MVGGSNPPFSICVKGEDMNSLKDVKDECSKCGDYFTCELCRQGHGIKQPRSNVAEMFECQMKHIDKRGKTVNEQ